MELPMRLATRAVLLFDSLRSAMSFTLLPRKMLLSLEKPRPYDLHCVQISKSADLRTDCAKRTGFWHNRLQCKSYQRQPSDAAESRSDVGAEAAGSQLLGIVRCGTPCEGLTVCSRAGSPR